ncbi:hypothetical protein M3D92_05265 [Micrococcus terreus]|uniref:hypothetical protein n=1 Tax=Micrococcus terreus TaxID=574650 RepID=UPI0021A87FAD|nr:hypothetical protein [Micrococcus terreus]MCT2088705.1 hypothetical protein [Micrococcus terreus]
MSQKAYSVTSDRTGLGLGYRIGWRLSYIATSIYGSADRQGTLDPRSQLRQERARRLMDGYREQGIEPPTELRQLLGG